MRFRATSIFKEGLNVSVIVIATARRASHPKTRHREPEGRGDLADAKKIASLCSQ